MPLACCGITSSESTIGDRAPFQLQRSQLGDAAARFKRVSGADEAVVLATCNRIEFYFVHDIKDDPRRWVRGFYASRDAAVDDEAYDRWFVRQETSVARHLFKVAAGLDSPLVGEYQVLNQVKGAYSAACAVGGPGAVLHKLFHLAFQVAKRVHSETEVDEGAQSFAGAAVEMMTELTDDDPTGKRALLVGVNQSTDVLLSHLSRLGMELTLANRSQFNAEKAARPYNAAVVGLDTLAEVLPGCDVLFSMTAAPGYVILPGHLPAGNNRKPLLAFDLAVPRDIHPGLAAMGRVTLFDIDDISRDLARRLERRNADLPYALHLVEEQVRGYENWKRRQHNPVSADLRETLESDRQAVLERFQGSFRQGDRKALEALTKSLCKQLLRRMTSQTAADTTQQPS